MERTKRMNTTTSASVPMFLSMSRKSKLGAPASCSRTAKVNKVATIRLLLKFQVTLRRGRRATRVFAEYCYLERRTCPTTGAPPALLVERENHVNGRVHVHRLAIQERRLIAPLANGVKRRLLQQRMAGHHFQRRNRAVLANDGVQAHSARDAGLARERRIDRLNAVDDACSLDVATNAERTSLVRPRRRRRCAHATDDAAKHTAHGATGNAAGDSTGHAGSHIGLGVFLNNFHFLGDDLRLHELAGIHQMGLRLHMDYLGYRGRRRGRGRGRGRSQHRRHHGFGERLGVDQRNKDQYPQKGDLKKHRDHDGPRLVGLLRIRTGNQHFFKQGSYLLPARARRPGTFSLLRVLLPAAGPVPAATPWPRQRFQATTSGAAIPKLEYVPTTIPTTRAKEKARSTWPPIRNRTSTVRKVKPLVKIVRERV